MGAMTPAERISIRLIESGQFIIKMRKLSHVEAVSPEKSLVSFTLHYSRQLSLFLIIPSLFDPTFTCYQLVSFRSDLPHNERLISSFLTLDRKLPSSHTWPPLAFSTVQYSHQHD